MSDSASIHGADGAILEAADQLPEFAEADARDLRACIATFAANESRNDALYEVYEGKVPLRRVPAYVPARYKSLHIGCPWPEIAVQSVVERSRFGGFVFPEDSDASDAMADIERRCDVALGYQSGLIDAQVAGVSFAVVGRDGDSACLRWHTAQSAAGLWDYAHGRLKCGFAIVDRARKGSAASGDEHTDTVPSAIDFYTERGCWELTREGGTGLWSAEWLGDPCGEPRMVALTFRPDGRHPLGRSRFTEPMRGIVQEYMANALNLHVASEFTAVGQKWATGLSDAQYDALVEEKWKFTADNVVLLTDNPATGSSPALGNFTQQSMEPILSVKRSLAADFAAAASIPVSELISQDSNPTSAEAITAMENKLISLVEAMNSRNALVLRRIALLLQAVDRDVAVSDLTDAEKSVMVHMERPETTSAAAQSDSAMKRVSAFPWMATSDVIIEDLGYSSEQVERLKRDRDRYQSRQLIATAMSGTGQSAAEEG